MKSSTKAVSLLIALTIVTGSAVAQRKVVDRKSEKEEYPALQVTEEKQEQNILHVQKRLNTFGRLVQMAREDRELMFQRIKNPNDFHNTLRNLEYTPRNTYIRYVKESPEFLLVGMGNTQEILGNIREMTQKGNAANINIPDLTFQQRDGVELTQFEFIKDDQNEAIGSRRKSVSLFFTQTNTQADTEQNLQLSMTVTRVVEDDQKDGVKVVEVIIDPTPLDQQMDDVVVVRRYNYKVPQVSILGMMSNTPNFPHRTKFKKKFYNKLSEHFYRLYMLVDGYASKDQNDYNENLIEELENSMTY